MILLASAWLPVLAVLGYAALSKLTGVRAFATAIAGYQIIPARLSHAAARLVIAAELAGAVLLAVPLTRRWGAALAAALFAAFCAGMASALRRGLRVDCGCFSAGHADTIGPGTLVRTGLLLALAAAAIPGATRPFQPAEFLIAALLLVLAVTAAELVTLLAAPAGDLA
jgi:Methylamine utilisation protein MauE